MENEQASSFETSTVCSSNSESFQNIENLCKQLSDDEGKEKNKTDPDLSLDLRGVHPNCDHVSENDEDEKLSAVMEQPEELVTIEGGQSLQEDQEDEELNCMLKERIESLREVMKNLKEQLRIEGEMWRKEREELQQLREQDDTFALEEATAAARAAAAAYAAESPLSNNLGDVLDITSDDTFTELTILEYEKKLAKYQDEFSFSQAEKRYNARWKLIANAYKKKLMEVERLCNEELEKVQQNASHLQPLKEMVSQWYTDEENHGDTIKSSDFGANLQKYAILKDSDIHNRYKFQKIDAEVNMAPEIFVARFKSEDLTKKDIFCGQS
ncbi:uncharacterized protein LOC143177067 [Calliopsis andreniformis]|uniref:uncharacterized protein LOC143177067 n=1 Tax=Calliopsis andreniformis TaxID=337506 RepID=UPI003FCEDA23